MSFWILPGLDACPVGDDVASPLSLDLLGNSEAVAQSAATEGATRGLLSSAAGGMVSPSPAVVGERAGGPENLAAFASEGQAHGFEGEDGSCFEGANAVGSVRTILQVECDVLRCLDQYSTPGERFRRPCGVLMRCVQLFRVVLVPIAPVATSRS